jgi:cytochrome c553
VLESATRGLRRMEAVLDRLPEQQVQRLAGQAASSTPQRESPTCPRWSW